MEKSVIFSKENQEKFKEEVEIMLESFSAGYDSIASVKSHTEPIQKKIQGINFLSGYSNRDNEEEIGSKLSENVEEVIKSVGREFERIIIVNFDLETFKRSNLAKRANIDADEDEKSGEAEMILVLPDRSIYEYKMTSESTEASKLLRVELNAMYEVVAEADRELSKEEHKEKVAMAVKELIKDIKAKYDRNYVYAYEE
jgi:hypothetical protein